MGKLELAGGVEGTTLREGVLSELVRQFMGSAEPCFCDDLEDVAHVEVEGSLPRGVI